MVFSSGVTFLLIVLDRVIKWKDSCLSEVFTFNGLWGLVQISWNH